ncbi:hypothetical protein ATCVTN60342_819R [Acanthocystis turfacea Chlorella virus TN603.4.2]|nr:hypothetical protein ATCVTN60342_819R [Acanthocystis turfacea Chlorella virus TN603.4.2]
MDAFVITQLLSKPAENFAELTPIAVANTKDAKVVVVEKKSGFSFMKLIQLVLSIGISLYAAHLSWSCSAGEHMFIRVLSALFAWFFGVIYILYFALFRSASCKIM